MPPEEGEECPPPQRRFEKPRRPADWPLASAPAVTAGVSANRPVPRGGAPPLARNPAKHPAARATPAVATLGTRAPTPHAHPCGKRPSSDVSLGPSAGGRSWTESGVGAGRGPVPGHTGSPVSARRAWGRAGRSAACGLGMSVQTDTRPAEEESVSGQENGEGPA